MTATPILHDPAMDFSGLTDKMDLASSPFLPVGDVEDLDFEFDQLDNQHPKPSNEDVMDDDIEHGMTHDGNAHAGDVEFLEDVTLESEEASHNIDDFAMDEARPEHQEEEGEEILYDEDEEDTTAVVDKPEQEGNHSLAQDLNDTEELFEPEESIAQAVDEQQATNTGSNHGAISDHTDEQTEPKVANTLPTEQPQEDFALDEQYARDDGDGPSVDPATTELADDPDVDNPETLAEPELELEDTFEDELEGQDMHGEQPDDTDYSTHAAALDEVQDEHAQVDGEKHGLAGTASFDLHPIKLIYLDQEMHLFPPTDGDSTYLIPDTHLAFEPVVKLLESCRAVLADSIEHHDELVLDIPEMGLHICEDSKYASQITLAQIVDVYISLNSNESEEITEPLECALSSRSCLLTQFKYLTEQAEKGRTFSDIAAEHVDSPHDGTEADFEAGAELQDELTHDQGDVVDATDAETQAAPATHEDQQQTVSSGGDPLGLDGVDSADVSHDQTVIGETHQGTDSQPSDVTAVEDLARGSTLPDGGVEALLGETSTTAPEDGSNPHTITGQGDELGLNEDDFTSEFFEDAIDQEDDEQGEHLREEAEDQSALQAAVAKEQAEDDLLEEDTLEDHLAEEQEVYEGEEFIVDFDDGLNGETSAGGEDDLGELGPEEVEAVATKITQKSSGDGQALNGASGSNQPPTTPSKSSKRKVSEEEDDLFLEMDTPEPKRRRPS